MNIQDRKVYFSAAFDHHLSVAILRVKGGLDYSNLTETYENPSYENSIESGTRTGLRTSPSSALVMHSDSNLSLTNVGVAVTETSGQGIDIEMGLGQQLGDKIEKKDNDEKTESRKKKAAAVKMDLVLKMSNEELMHVESINRFRKKQGKGYVNLFFSFVIHINITLFFLF